MKIEPTQITEEQGIHKEWAEEVKEMTLEKLPEFIRKLTQDYIHDYGTICHAIASGAIATAKAIDRSPAGGITGFQAGCIMWEMIRQWGVFGDGPLRMQQMENLLFPQYAYKFTTISQDIWDRIQAMARENIAKNETAHPDVIAHWKSIEAGRVPFGLSVRKAPTHD